jgi:hypothetical protein
MPAGYDYTVYESSLDGPEVGKFHHDGSNGLSGPQHGDIIRLDEMIGRWRVTASDPPAMGHDAVTSQGTGKLTVERVEDDLVTPHGD